MCSPSFGHRPVVCPDLAAHPIYHHLRESIDAHLGIVVAAMAAGPYVEHQTAWSIKKFVRTARRYRTVKVRAGRKILTAADPLADDLRQAITKIGGQPEHEDEPTREPASGIEIALNLSPTACAISLDRVNRRAGRVYRIDAEGRSETDFYLSTVGRQAVCRPPRNTSPLFAEATIWTVLYGRQVIAAV